MHRTGARLAMVIAIAAALAAPAAAAAATSADGSTYVLTSFDGTTILGLNDQGRTLSSALTGTTTYRAAQLDKYHPTDPYREACGAAAAEYNAALVAVTSDGSLQTAIGSLAALGCKARVVFSPSGPYLPPNPIRVLSFQPVP